MTKNKKNTISDQLNKLSLKIEAIYKGLGNPNQPIEKLSQDLDSVAQSTIELRQDFESKRSTKLIKYRTQGEEQQTILKMENLLEGTTLGILERELNTLKNKIESKRLKERETNENTDLKIIIDELNVKLLQHTKEIIKSYDFYKEKRLVKKLIDNAKDMDSLTSIVEKHASLEKLVEIFIELDSRIEDELERADLILGQSGKEAWLCSDNVFRLKDVDVKQSTTIDQSVVEMSSGQFRQ